MTHIMVIQAKGGVCKTTTTYQLATQLARSGKRVLVVDADGQMDLTRLFVRDALETVDQDDCFHFIKRHGLTSLYEAIELFRHQGHLDPKTELPKTHAIEENLHLLVGHFDTTMQDEHIGAALNTLWAFPCNRNIPSVPSWIIRQVSAAVAADIVLIDTNPNQGLLNAFLWWGSDFYVVPCLPTDFSAHATRTLAARLKQRIAQITNILPELDKAGYVKPTSRQPPRCLGIMPPPPQSLLNSRCTGLVCNNLHQQQEPHLTRWKRTILQIAREELDPCAKDGFLWDLDTSAMKDGPLSDTHRDHIWVGVSNILTYMATTLAVSQEEGEEDDEEDTLPLHPRKRRKLIHNT